MGREFEPCQDRHFVLEQENVSTLLSTGWSQDRTRETGDSISCRLSSQSSLNKCIQTNQSVLITS